MLETARGRGREIPKAIKAILLDALELRDRHEAGEISEQDFLAELAKLEGQLRAQLARPVSGADSPQGRLLRHLAREFDALFALLRLPGVPATNRMAEQALRPAVVNRKVWGGNRTWNGARHQERLMSVLRTARQQQCDPITILADLLRTPGVCRSTRTTRACLPPLNKYILPYLALGPGMLVKYVVPNLIKYMAEVVERFTAEF